MRFPLKSGPRPADIENVTVIPSLAPLAVIGYVVFGFDAEAAAAAGHVIGPVPVFGAAPAVPAALAECEAFAAAFGGTVAPVVQSDYSAEFDPASEEAPMNG